MATKLNDENDTKLLCPYQNRKSCSSPRGNRSVLPERAYPNSQKPSVPAKMSMYFYIQRAAITCGIVILSPNCTITIEHLHMMSQHSNSLATTTAAILVHNENLLRLCTNRFHGKRMHVTLYTAASLLTASTTLLRNTVMSPSTLNANSTKRNPAF